VWLAVLEQRHTPSLLNFKQLKGACSWGAERPRDEVAGLTQILVPVVLGCMRMYCAWYGFAIWRRGRVLRKQLYQHNRIANMWMRLEVLVVSLLRGLHHRTAA
jgi:hypothetical protein